MAKLSLGARQEIFSLCLAKLILHMYLKGYTVRFGDVGAKKRTPLEHKLDSLHYESCAADLNLFKDGAFLSKTEDHAEFGAYWETLHLLCRWGGRFNDGNHYEIKRGSV